MKIIKAIKIMNFILALVVVVTGTIHEIYPRIIPDWLFNTMWIIGAYLIINFCLALYKEKKEKTELKAQQEYTIKLKCILPADAYLLSFEYYPKTFDEYFKIEIKHNESKHLFHTKKGCIYHNDELVCDSGYHYKEKESTFGKMLTIIKQEFT